MERPPQLEAIELLAAGEGGHTPEHDVIDALAHKAVDMVGQPDPIDMGQESNVARIQVPEGDRLGAALNHVKNVLVKHVGRNEVVPNSKSPFIIELDVTVESS